MGDIFTLSIPVVSNRKPVNNCPVTINANRPEVLIFGTEIMIAVTTKAPNIPPENLYQAIDEKARRPGTGCLIKKTITPQNIVPTIKDMRAV